MTPAPFALLVVTAALGQAAPKVPAITITPAPEPVPALHYLLLPDRADEISGNAATLYFLALNWVSMGIGRRPMFTKKSTKHLRLR